ncbi:hypothetical protein PIB30_086351 [Stylosanthes scabra]|uniref:Uncharacterized protein n=1 Tax=Stylosanthes scabra TaxID=79078 RepID=A0ABU6RTI9_9FABA|nr:hypothetical protein [Stylosanthes scabra]
MERVRVDHSHSFPNDSGWEDEVVYFAAEGISEGIQTCHKSLSGRMFSDRFFSIGTMEGAMAAIWGIPEGFQEECHAPNSFLSHIRARVELRVASRIDSELIQKQLWHYSPPLFGDHNFHTGAPIDAPFVATRSSLHPLRIYASYEVWVSCFHTYSSHENLQKSRLFNLGGFSDSHDVGAALAYYGATIMSK